MTRFDECDSLCFSKNRVLERGPTRGARSLESVASPLSASP